MEEPDNWSGIAVCEFGTLVWNSYISRWKWNGLLQSSTTIPFDLVVVIEADDDSITGTPVS